MAQLAAAQRLLSAARRRKSVNAIVEEVEEDAKDTGPKLRLLDLWFIGVGSTVGSGVFVLTGQVMPFTGPSAVLSWLCAGVVCSLSACSYIELSRRIPTSGSCYTFSLHALGELGALIGAVCLTLEYGISGAGVARTWSSLVATLSGRGDQMFFWYAEVHGDDDLYFDWVAAACVAASVVITAAGLKLGKCVINVFAAAKLVLVCVLTVGGLCVWKRDIFSSVDVFFPYGLSGTVVGVSKLFFGFIGFDEVCCLAGKAYRPKRTMPMALFGTLLGAAVISSAAQLALCVMVSANGSTQWPFAFEAQGWTAMKVIASVGQVVVLPLVVYLSFLPQPELLAAMARDGLAPEFFNAQGRNGAYIIGSLSSGSAMILAAACVPFSVLWDVISLGVLLSFNLTNTCLIMVRYGNGGQVSQPEVAGLMGAFWCFSAPAAYVFWLGVFQPAFSSGSWSIPGLVLGLVLLVVGIFILAAIRIRGEQVKDPTSDVLNDESSGFRTCGVPFVPGLAMFLNFMLMATFNFWDHLYLGVVLVFCVMGYAAGRRDERAIGAKDVGAPPMVEAVSSPSREPPLRNASDEGAAPVDESRAPSEAGRDAVAGAGPVAQIGSLRLWAGKGRLWRL